MRAGCTNHLLLRVFVAASIAVAPCFAFSYDTYFTYQVQEGDSLSHILYDKFQISPVYGKHGYIHQVTWLNHGKILEEGDLITVGDILLIPALSPEAFKYGHLVKTQRQVASEARVVVPEAPVVMPAPPVPPPKTQVCEAPVLPLTAPAPAAAPAPQKQALPPVVHAQNDQDFEPFSKVEVAAGASYLGLFGYQTSNQTSGRLLTGLSPSAEVSWRQIWDKDTSSRVYFGLQSIQFENDPSGASIANPSLFNSDFGLGMSQKLASRLSFNFNFEVAQTLFYEGVSSGGLAINQVPIMRLHPQLELVLIKRRPFKISFLGGASYYGSSSYDNYSIQSGYGYDGALQISQEFKRSVFSCKVSYLERDQNTTYLNLVEKDMGLTCGLSWEL